MSATASEKGDANAMWAAPPAVVELAGHDVHVWRVNLRASADQLDAAGNDLDDDERARAARFRRPGDRDRYTLAHIGLRRILAGYLKAPPDGVRYVLGAQGKPGLTPELEDSRLRFNLAHSGDLALVAVAIGREVGVDVEQFRPLPEAEPIAVRHFSADEREALAKLPAEERPSAFFQIWTSKEAFIKATGKGLSYPLSSFSVPPPSGGAERPALVDDSGPTQRWALRSLAPGAGYAAAVVAEGADWELRLWRF